MQPLAARAMSSAASRRHGPTSPPRCCEPVRRQMQTPPRSAGLLAVEFDQPALLEHEAKIADVVLDLIEWAIVLPGEELGRSAHRCRPVECVKHPPACGIDTVVLAGLQVQDHRLLRERTMDDVFGKSNLRVENVRLVHLRL